MHRPQISGGTSRLYELGWNRVESVNGAENDGGCGLYDGEKNRGLAARHGRWQ